MNLPDGKLLTSLIGALLLMFSLLTSCDRVAIGDKLSDVNPEPARFDTDRFDQGVFGD